MSDHWRITIRYNNGDDQSVVVDRNQSGVRTYAEEGHQIIHFGRTNDDGEWQELITAPMASVRSWD